MIVHRARPEGLLRNPSNVYQDHQYSAYQAMLEKRRQVILARQQQLACGGRSLSGG